MKNFIFVFVLSFMTFTIAYAWDDFYGEASVFNGDTDEGVVQIGDGELGPRSVKLWVQALYGGRAEMYIDGHECEVDEIDKYCTWTKPPDRVGGYIYWEIWSYGQDSYAAVHWNVYY